MPLPTIDELCAQIRAHFGTGREYAFPSPEKIAGAEQKLGSKLPPDYLRFLELTHDVKTPWLFLLIDPNGHFFAPAHDILDATLSRRKDGMPARYIIIQKRGGDGGYDAFDTQQPVEQESDFKVVDLVYGRKPMVKSTGLTFRQWLHAKFQDQLAKS